MARAAGYFLWRAHDYTGASGAGHHAGGAARSVSAVGQHSGGGTLSQASDGFVSAQPQCAIVRAVAPGWVEMTGFGYLELLGLTAPEIVVSLTGIAVLV